MAEDIVPTQPLSPSLPVNPPPDDKRRHSEKNKNKSEQGTTQQNEPKDRQHQGLFDEYV
ncbi:MAG: hypothetical protein IBX57_01965 [Gammaproteobacteria bacterium]|nr:hypothetical protein [Gammaproteobacteria bacterium]